MVRLSKNATVSDIFMDAQRSMATHARCVKALTRLRIAADPREYTRPFTVALRQLLLANKEAASVDRVAKFVVRFATHVADGEESANEDLVTFLFKFLAKRTRAKAPGVRSRAAHLLGLLLPALPSNFELPDSFDQVQEALAERLMDKVGSVRAHAVRACRLLQDRDPEDPFTERILHLMEHDASPAVRKAALLSVRVESYTLQAILRRTRDLSSSVRSAAFKFVGQVFHVRNLTVDQRVSLVKNGLRDRVSSVRKACLRMVTAHWMGKQSMSHLDLLRVLDVVLHEEECTIMLRAILETTDQFQDWPEGEGMAEEHYFVLRVYAQHAHDAYGGAGNARVEEVLPSLMQLAHEMQDHMDNSFICHQLLLLCQLHDMTDEAGRRAVSEQLRNLILSPDTDSDLVKDIMTTLARVHEDESDYVQVALEAVTVIREPLVHLTSGPAQQAFALLERKHAQLSAEVDRLVTEEGVPQDDESVQHALAQVEAIASRLAIKTHLLEHIWYRAITIVEVLLESTRRGLQHPGMRPIFHDLVVPSLQQPEACARDVGVRCLTVFCILDGTRALARKYVTAIIERANEDESDAVRLTAMRSLFDLAMLFRQPTFELDGRWDSMLRCLETFLHSDNTVWQSIAVEGFAKLLLSDAIPSPSDVGRIFSHFVLLFFDPATNDAIGMRQCLGVFFPTYAFSAALHQHAIAMAVIPIMRTLFAATQGSTWFSVSPARVLRFLCYLCDTYNAQYEAMEEGALSASMPTTASALSTNVVQDGDGSASPVRRVARVHHHHELLAEALLLEILTNDPPAMAEVGVYAEALARIKLVPGCVNTCSLLASLAQRCVSHVEATKERKCLTAFQGYVTGAPVMVQDGADVECVDDFALDGIVTAWSQTRMDQEPQLVLADRERRRGRRAEVVIPYVLQGVDEEDEESEDVGTLLRVQGAQDSPLPASAEHTPRSLGRLPASVRLARFDEVGDDDDDADEDDDDADAVDESEDLLVLDSAGSSPAVGGENAARNHLEDYSSASNVTPVVGSHHRRKQKKATKQGRGSTTVAKRDRRHLQAATTESSSPLSNSVRDSLLTPVATPVTTKRARGIKHSTTSFAKAVRERQTSAV